MSGCSFAINNYSGMSIISSILESLFSLGDSIIYTIGATWISGNVFLDWGSKGKHFYTSVVLEDFPEVLGCGLSPGPET